MPGPNNRLQPRKFYRNENCSSACTLGSGKLPGEMADIVHTWFEGGDNNDTIEAKAAKVGVKISNGAIGRHRRNHLTPVDDHSPDPTDQKLEKINHVDFLEQLVARGAKNVNVARVSPELALKAVEMIHRLNAGNEMSTFMQAVSSAMVDGDDEDEYLTPIEAADAKRALDEQQQGESVIE